MKKNILATIRAAIPLLIALTVGVLACYFFLKFFQPSGWLLSANRDDLSKLSPDAKAMLADLAFSGNVVSATELFSTFTGYYNGLIALLITLLALFAGLVSFKIFQSRDEHDEILKHRMNVFFRDFEKKSSPNDIAILANEYEALQGYLKARVAQIVMDSHADEYKDTIQETVEGVLSDTLMDMVNERVEEFFSDMDQSVLDKIYDHCEARRTAAERANQVTLPNEGEINIAQKISTHERPAQDALAEVFDETVENIEETKNN